MVTTSFSSSFDVFRAWNEYNSSNTINYMEMYVPDNLAPNSGCYAKICSNGNLDLGTAFNGQGNWRVFTTLGKFQGISK